MRGASLEPFLFFFTFVIVGNAYPTYVFVPDVNDSSKDNSIMTSMSDSAVSVTPYKCVYIPSNLDYCRFPSYKSEKILQEHKSPESKRKLLKSNKIHFLKQSMYAVETKKFQRQSFVETIIYEIQRCVPLRLPFSLPWCTDEDLSSKKKEIRELYPFMIDGLKTIDEFPKYNFSQKIACISKTANNTEIDIPCDIHK
ncbi:uncharacterized protein LOC105430192 isoform X2 [Pogonomyrmex barbatus]|uniref:Uncharacterized protein LOC105430192 isoform X1 n=1 Tax=Pogonomyrmex barbatus TaxID=144034 RepID=A0A6I9WQL9_9HYME|nr:uncharacterized protein LOC105430192 isoform X1 [Pogonomyrmex barbatus]XP_011641910.1 uncharacterized protein LOC105430192 isoform X1 [Pogonomyrmex barbatus]XP_011641911.1 uncharacterized protein LOC105430192 isoform X1 [Pogonomyrmex barbatus]XP_011641912.1 uncharacterized protein LOC105430192 isoform X2 [Pogonomyrmex barbatus]XP_011641913.1 uncharacterized protein LOC105430192 isoform X1 [Pogonomyrmex barbatus]XP_011641914.1 uncharacterized protein LOC105430192 isoform X2 [Pogonomyrmex bar